MDEDINTALEEAVAEEQPDELPQEPQEGTPDDGAVAKQDEAPKKKFIKKLLLIYLCAFCFLSVIGIIAAFAFAQHAQLNSLSHDNKELEDEVQRLKQSRVTASDLAGAEGLIRQLQPKLDGMVVRPIAEAVLKYASMYELPYQLVLSVIACESNFELTAKSNNDAIGLMQICPKSHSIDLGKVGIKEHEVYYIEHNIHLGCMILRKYYDETDSIASALAKLVEDDTHIMQILVSFTNTVITDTTREIHEEKPAVEKR
jgi:hypothetical protein